MGLTKRIRNFADMDMGWSGMCCFRSCDGVDGARAASPAARADSCTPWHPVSFACPLYEDANSSALRFKTMSVGCSTWTLSNASNELPSIQPTASQAFSDCGSARAMAAVLFEEHQPCYPPSMRGSPCQPTMPLNAAFGSALICDEQPWQMPGDESVSEADAILEITPRYSNLPTALRISQRAGHEWDDLPKHGGLLQPLLLSATNAACLGTPHIICSNLAGQEELPHHHTHTSSRFVQQSECTSLAIFMTSSSSNVSDDGGGGGEDVEVSCYARRRRSTGASTSSTGGFEAGLNLTIAFEQLTVHRDQVLGVGQATTVCLGEYQGQPVAVKMLLNSLQGSGKKELEAFNQELACFQALSHASVVRCFGGSQTAPHLFIVEELMDCTLSNLLYAAQPRQRLTMRRILSIGLDVAHGLEYMHQLTPAIIHRDLKPANILLTADGRAKISDFGLARFKLMSCVQTERRSAGTLVYMAPECFDPSVGRITEQCDLFSFGVIMWELCTGTPPWEGYAATEFLQRMVIDGARLPMPVDDLTCPMALRNIISQCWSQDPTDRPHCREVVNVLTRMLRHTTY